MGESNMEPLFMMETVMTEELYMRFNRVHFKRQ